MDTSRDVAKNRESEMAQEMRALKAAPASREQEDGRDVGAPGGKKAVKGDDGARERARDTVQKIEDSFVKLDAAVEKLDAATSMVVDVCDEQEQLMEKVESLVGFFDDGKDGLKMSMEALSDYMVMCQKKALQKAVDQAVDQIGRLAEAAQMTEGESAAAGDAADRFFAFLGKLSLAAVVVASAAIVVKGLLF